MRELMNVRAWYLEVYPDDELGPSIDPGLNFEDIFRALDSYKDIYKVLKVDDSLVRERVFTELADIMQVPYSYVYEQWLKSA